MSIETQKYKEGYEYAKAVFAADECLADLVDGVEDGERDGVNPQFIKGMQKFIDEKGLDI